MTIKFVKISIVALIATTLTFTSCKKKDDAQPDATQEQQAVESASFSERAFEGTQDIGEQSMDQSGMQARPAAGSDQAENVPFPAGGPCADITTVLTPTGSTPNTATGRLVTINYGQTGCVSADGRTRKGIVYITFERPASAVGNQNPYNIEGRVVYITFGTGADAHYIDGVKVEGVHKTTVLIGTSLPTLAAGQLERNHRIEVGGVNTSGTISGNAKLTFPDGTTHEWNADRTRKVTADVVGTPGTPNFVPMINRSSIVVKLFGTQNGKTRQNNTFSANTANTEAERLWFKMCALTVGTTTLPARLTPVQGKITIAGSNRPTVVLDYGAGACDNQYTATVNGQTFNLTF